MTIEEELNEIHREVEEAARKSREKQKIKKDINYFLPLIQTAEDGPNIHFVNEDDNRPDCKCFLCNLGSDFRIFAFSDLLKEHNFDLKTLFYNTETRIKDKSTKQRFLKALETIKNSIK